MDDVFKQHEANIKAACKQVLKDSIDQETPLSAEVTFIYQTADDKYYKQTSVISAVYLDKHGTFSLEEETRDEEMSVDDFLDHLITFKNEDKGAVTENKRKRGRPRTRPLK